MTSEDFSIKKRIKSFSYAFRGLLLLFKEQHNARIHFVVALLVIAAGFFFDIKPTEWLLVVISIVMVLGAELINSAIEYLCDVVSKEYHPGIRDAKDIAAGAVLIISIGAAITGGIIFIPYIINFLK